MPEMYNLLDPNNHETLWDFSKESPDIVVINLFQNDSWLVNRTDSKEFEYRFGTGPKPGEDFIIQSYKKFVLSIRDEYPGAYIICALGSMDITKKGSPWPTYIEKAAVSLADEKIHTHFFPYTNVTGHPEVLHHKKMSESLIRFIDEHIVW